MPVEETNFTVGIVVAVGDKDEMLGSQSVPPGNITPLSVTDEIKIAHVTVYYYEIQD